METLAHTHPVTPAEWGIFAILALLLLAGLILEVRNARRNQMYDKADAEFKRKAIESLQRIEGLAGAARIEATVVGSKVVSLAKKTDEVLAGLYEGLTVVRIEGLTEEDDGA